MKKYLMLLTVAVLLILTVGIATAETYETYDYENKQLWYDVSPTINDFSDGVYPSAYALFDMLGSEEKDWDVDAMINSPLGEALINQMAFWSTHSDPMGEDVLEYWEDLGIRKEMHQADDEENHWASYVPLEAYESTDTLYPVLILFRGGNDPIYAAEGFGFVEYGAEAGYITVIPYNREPEGVVAMLEQLKELYPIDESRIYISGNSYGGYYAWKNAMTNPELFAAIAPFGNPVNGFGIISSITTDQIIKLAQLRMPVCLMNGSKDTYAVLPVANEEQLSCLNMWLACNECVFETATMAITQALTSESDDLTKRKSGIDFTSTWTEQHDGTDFYFGEFYDEDGVAMYRAIIVENGSHWHAPSYAELAWDYMSQFSRDTETGELIIN